MLEFQSIFEAQDYTFGNQKYRSPFSKFQHKMDKKFNNFFPGNKFVNKFGNKLEISLFQAQNFVSTRKKSQEVVFVDRSQGPRDQFKSGSEPVHDPRQ